MNTFDLAIAYDWEYDIEFVNAIEKYLQKNGLTTYIINYKNISEATEDVKNRRFNFRCYLDRASDVDENFLELAKILTRRKIKIFNPYKKKPACN